MAVGRTDLGKCPQWCQRRMEGTGDGEGSAGKQGGKKSRDPYNQNSPEGWL